MGLDPVTEYGEAVSYAMPGTTGVIIASVDSEMGARYLGFTVKETSGTTAATFTIYDNASAASGDILEVVTLRPGESTGDHYAQPGRNVRNGLYISITGAIGGAVFVANG